MNPQRAVVSGILQSKMLPTRAGIKFSAMLVGHNFGIVCKWVYRETKNRCSSSIKGKIRGFILSSTVFHSPHVLYNEKFSMFCCQKQKKNENEIYSPKSSRVLELIRKMWDQLTQWFGGDDWTAEASNFATQAQNRNPCLSCLVKRIMRNLHLKIRTTPRASCTQRVKTKADSSTRARNLFVVFPVGVRPFAAL